MGQTIGKVPCPKCPFCGKETVAISMENHDGSGWTCGWSCDCIFIKKWEEYRNKQIIKTDYPIIKKPLP